MTRPRPAYDSPRLWPKGPGPARSRRHYRLKPGVPRRRLSASFRAGVRYRRCPFKPFFSRTFLSSIAPPHAPCAVLYPVPCCSGDGPCTYESCSGAGQAVCLRRLGRWYGNHLPWAGIVASHLWPSTAGVLGQIRRVIGCLIGCFLDLLAEVQSRVVARVSGCGTITSLSFLATVRAFIRSIPPRTRRVLCSVGTRAAWVLISARNPMVWPIWGCRARHGQTDGGTCRRPHGIVGLGVLARLALCRRCRRLRAHARRCRARSSAGPNVCDAVTVTVGKPVPPVSQSVRVLFANKILQIEQRII